MTLPAYVQEAMNKKAPPTDIDSIIAEASEKYGIEPELIKAQIDVESKGRPLAISKKGARGLMQLIPSTAKAMGVEDITDPYQNIMGGTKYLRQQLDQFENNKELALAAYNAGPSAVRKYGGIPPFKETQEYVPKVLNKYNEYKGALEASPTEALAADQISGLPDYVRKAMTKEQSKQSFDPRTEPQEWDPEWMKDHPNLAGLYGAGKGILEQAIAPTIEAVGMVAGSVYSPAVGTALGYGIAKQLNDVLIEAYDRLGGEAPTSTTITEEMKQSAADVGTALILGKATEMGS